MPSHRTGHRVPRFDFRAQRNPYQLRTITRNWQKRTTSILVYTKLYHTILHIILYFKPYALYNAILFYVILCSSILYYTVHYFLLTLVQGKKREDRGRWLRTDVEDLSRQGSVALLTDSRFRVQSLSFRALRFRV